MAEHKINCPGCDQHLSVPEELAGQQIDCPSCSKTMTVPTFTEVGEDDEEWVEDSTPESSKLIVGIAAGIAVLGVVAFIALGGDDSQEEEPELATPVGMTNEPPRSVPTSEITKEKDSEIEKIKDRLAKGEPLNQYNQNGYTELFIAIEANDVELVKQLLAAGADPNAAERQRTSPLSFPTDKRTPLFLAVNQGSKELCELLLSNGADVNHKNSTKLTATDCAILDLEDEKDPNKAERISDVIDFLTANGGKHLTDEKRSEALFAHISGMGMGMGMNPMMPPGGDPFGMGMGGGGFGMPTEDFDRAELFEEEIEEINQRLAKGGALNQYDEMGYTELMIAARADDLDLAKRLLEKKVNPNKKVRGALGAMQGGIHTGQTALHLAAETQNKAMCELLYENGALLNVKDAMGFTPLDTVLFMFDPSVDVFSNQKIKPKLTRKGKETIAYLRSKGGKNMTAKQREGIWAKNDPFQQMMMPPPGMMPGMMPGYRNGQNDPFGVGIDPNNPFGAGYGMPPRSESKKRERK
jgi:ankyrin repeat protein